jgi:hypothetical protein
VAVTAKMKAPRRSAARPRAARRKEKSGSAASGPPEEVIIVFGRPASHNANTAAKKRWATKVRKAARAVVTSPLADPALYVTVMFFYDAGRGQLQDADNASKPICDALQGLAYNNDSQVSHRSAQRRDLSGTFTVKNAHPRILDALRQGSEFVAIKIRAEGEDIHKL